MTLRKQCPVHYFTHCCNKMPYQSSSSSRELNLPHSSKGCSPPRSTRSHCSHREAEGQADGCLCLAQFLLCRYFQTPVPLHVVGLSPQVKSSYLSTPSSESPSDSTIHQNELSRKPDVVGKYALQAVVPFVSRLWVRQSLASL